MGRVTIRWKTRRACLRMATWATWTYTCFKTSVFLAAMARPTDAKCTTCTRPRTIITCTMCILSLTPTLPYYQSIPPKMFSIFDVPTLTSAYDQLLRPAASVQSASREIRITTIRPASSACRCI
ncbi:hypothetical protein EDB85DRAFT_269694 [Lactarius pseudohatsudake]|nr:hypothetical protein EDB85DRAFT_269694 [Lactarius pseudohatsudake]